jgi:hypothetical protein
VLGLGEEVRELAAVELSLADLAALEQGFPGRVEGAVEEGEEGEGVGGQDLAVRLVDLAENVDALEDGFGVGHVGEGSMG